MKKSKQLNEVIVSFKDDEFLLANKDVSLSIEAGEYNDVLDYLTKIGIEEIKYGSRQFHTEYEVYNEEQYLDAFLDVKEAVERNKLSSGFEHFCKYGYEEIITEKRSWNIKSDEFGYIDSIDAMTISGWAGSVEDKPKVSLFFDEIFVTDIIPDIERADLKAHPDYVNALGFTVEFDGTILLKLFEKTEEVTVRIKVNEKWLKPETHLKKEKWYASINKFFSKEHFLNFLPLFENNLEKALSLNNIIDSLILFKEYGLDQSLSELRVNIIGEISKRILGDEEEREKLYRLLIDNQDILLEVSKRLYTQDNPQLVVLVNEVLSVINHQDAQQIVLNATGDNECIFNIEKLEQDIEDDELLFYLSSNPDQILKTWQSFDAQERLDKAFSFMNLYVFLQNFEDMRKLGLSLNELNKLVLTESRLTAEGLQQYMFNNYQEWEGFLVTLYFISSGVKTEMLISLSKYLIDHLSGFDYVNSSAVLWILRDRLFQNTEVKEQVIAELMETLRWIIDSKALWSDVLIKSLYLNYLHILLRSGNILFDEVYKLGLNHYLLDHQFLLDKTLLTQEFLDEEYLVWVESVEVSRQNAMALLGDMDQVDELAYQLNGLEYLSPDIVKKIKFEIYSNILNLSPSELSQRHAAYEMLKVGGTYDGLMASSKLSDVKLQKYYETALVNQTIKWHSKSANNYWYQQALLVRRSSEKKRVLYLEKLYLHITDPLATGYGQLRLIRLFFSELLWSVEEGLLLDTLCLDSLAIADVIAKVVSLNSGAIEYSKIFEYYIKLIAFKETFVLDKFLDEVKDFETRDRLKEILKIENNYKIETSTAKKYIRQAMLYPYTLIMVYSCQAYIPTRQKVIRETWYQRAKELGIDCAFVVGGSEVSKVEGDMLYLAVDDTYERLPQKSVEMFRFAHEQFSYEHFMKIDDDCFVNIDAYFSDDALFNADYYGRFLHRNIGDMDRTWHQKKSKTVEAQNAIDLSPEPSWYADGSTGYVLSKLACKQLDDAYNADNNKELVDNSFMEDKLVGDLLISRGFKVDSTNFTSVIYRKLTEKVEATFWEYNVLPTSENSVKVLHCETENTMRRVWEKFNNLNSTITQKQYFSNRKIENFKGTYSDQPFIEEINIKVDLLGAAKHIGVIVCKNEYVHLPVLLEHHRKIGIKHFIYIDNMSNDESLEYMIDQTDVSVFSTTQEYKNFHFSVDWLESAFSNFCYGKWILVIDADELFIYDGYEKQSISSLTNYADKNGFDSFLAPMIDMYNKEELSKARLDNNIPYTVCNYFDSKVTMDIQDKTTFGPFSNSPVYAGGLRARVFGKYNSAPSYSYLNQKYCLFKYNPMHKFIEGIHFMGNNNPAPVRAALLHFKYHAGFYNKVHEQILSAQHWNGSQEYKRYLNKLEHNDTLSLYDEEVSIQYTGSKSLIEAGYMDKLI